MNKTVTEVADEARQKGKFHRVVVTAEIPMFIEIDVVDYLGLRSDEFIIAEAKSRAVSEWIRLLANLSGDELNAEIVKTGPLRAKKGEEE